MRHDSAKREWRTMSRRVLFVGIAVVLAGGAFHAVNDAADGQVKRAVRVQRAAVQVLRRAPGAEVSPTDKLALERRALNRILYRNRNRQLVLDRGLEALDGGDLTTGLEYLQQLLDRHDDAFVWKEGTDRIVSVRTIVEERLANADRQTLDAYQQLYGVEASRLLREAERTGNAALYREAGRRFFLTEAGFQAVDQLAARSLDHGRTEAAARLWDRLLNSAAHKDRVTDVLRLKAAFAHRLAGNAPRGRELLDAIQSSRMRIAGRATPPETWLARITPRGRNSVSGGDWPVYLGDASRSRIPRGSAPLVKPLWKHAYAGKDPGPFTGLLENWLDGQVGGYRSTAVANTPISVGGAIVVRDFERITARDLETGRELWRYECASSPVAAAREVLSGDRKPGEPSFIDVVRAYAGNSTIGTLSSDGRRIFAVDGVQLKTTRTPPRRGRAYVPRSSGNEAARTNRLVALPASIPDSLAVSSDGKEQSIQPLWTIGGTEEAASKSNPLAGSFFLGPPLPVDGRLFSLTESDGQINLVSLDPHTGGLLWKQGIAIVDLTIDRDARRFARACQPAFAEGVVVCPTGVGALVGVDAVSGRLLWAAHPGGTSAAAFNSPAQQRSAREKGHPGFPHAPVVVDGRVLSMPADADHVHCIDLHGGETIWKTPRSDDEYIGGINGGVALMVHARGCRGLSLTDGEVQWTNACGVPSGRGTAAGDVYLLPLEEGRVATVRFSDGRESGLTLSGSTTEDDRVEDWKPGNLVAAGNVILSAGIHDVTAFRQSAAMLEDVRKALVQNPESVDNRLLASELELLQGNLQAADAHLSDKFVAGLPAERRPRAVEMKSELLYLQLREGAGDPFAVLDRLEKLVASPRQRARLLMHRADAHIQAGDFDALKQDVAEFKSLKIDGLLPSVDDPHLETSAESWIPGVVNRVRTSFGPNELDGVRTSIQVEQQQVLDDGGVDELRRFATTYATWPEAAPVRTALAERLIALGRYQEAEFLLLKNRTNEDAGVSGDATLSLARMWSRLGLHEESAGLVEELAGKFAETHLSHGLNGRRAAAAVLENDLTAKALKARRGPQHRVSRAVVTETRWIENDPKLEQIYSHYRRRFLTPAGDSFELLDKSIGVGEGRMAVVDRQLGVQVGEKTIPARNSYPSLTRNAHVGHFVPVGAASQMLGISLLEYWDPNPLWKLEPRTLAGREEIVRVGPAGTSFCTFQTHGRLIVVDPGSGRVLWQRDDLEPGGGLHGDPYAGLLGDEIALVVFAADRSTYSAYETTTGKLLRRGTLDVNPQQARHVFGRRLFYHEPDAEGLAMRIWDPVTGESKLTARMQPQSRQRAALTPENELVLIGSDGELSIRDVANERTLLEASLPADDVKNVNYVRACRDDDLFLVNLQRTVQVPGVRTYSYYATDTFLPSMQVVGDLLAVDPASDRVLWTRRINQRTLVRTPNHRLPFIILVSRIRDRANGNRQSMLIELLDRKTGETLARRDNILSDRFVHLHYDADASVIELHGMQTIVKIEFGPEKQIPTNDRTF